MLISLEAQRTILWVMLVCGTFGTLVAFYLGARLWKKLA